MGRVRDIGMELSVTPPGEVTHHFMQGRGWRAYVNRDGISVAGDFHGDITSARDDLAVRLIVRDVDVPGLTD